MDAACVLASSGPVGIIRWDRELGQSLAGWGGEAGKNAFGLESWTTSKSFTEGGVLTEDLASKRKQQEGKRSGWDPAWLQSRLLERGFWKL